MRGRRPSEVLASATALLDRVGLVLVARLADMTEASTAWPSGSAAYRAGFTNITFCDEHEQDSCPCGGGAHVASVSDPTGEAATGSDRAAGHRREVERLLWSIDRSARRLEQLVSLYEPRAASESERRETLRDNEREEGCVSCRRVSAAKGVQRWEPVFRDDLCRWCYDWRRATGQLPPLVDLERHHRGERIRRPA